MLALSQVILGVQDLEAAAVRMRALGLEVLDGGVHPGLGTANRIVPLDGQYLELLGVVDRGLAEANEYGQAVLRGTARGDRLLRWSLRIDDIDDVATRLGLQIQHRQRLRPDGVRLTWRAAGLSVALRDGWSPFFMQWDDPPSTRACCRWSTPGGAARVARLDVCPADEGRLARWTAGADAPLRLIDGEPGLGRVALATAAGAVVLELP